MVGASLLLREGVPVVAVDDDFATVSATSLLPIVSEGHAATIGDAYSD